MAVFEFNFYSTKLGRYVPAIGILPTDGGEVHPECILECYERPMKTIYLLSGYSGGHTDWLHYTQIVTFCLKYNVAAFMPAGENSFYLDSKKRDAYYEQFVAEEFVNYTRKTFAAVSDKREDTFIGGISMGGFGALYLGMRHSKVFSKILALAPGILCYGYNEHSNFFFDAGMTKEYCDTMFGDPKKLILSEANLEVLYQRLKRDKEEIPAIYLTCGTEDFVLEHSRVFYQFLKKENASFYYEETPGTHEWYIWNGHIDKALRWAVGRAD
ncbi:MAG: alpha/beta hydrolase-fold protein [Lachnospiraceae bacterium]|nr:hypothetical protein C819_03701 [Lachnospiraceae bacterium 10-1]MCX4351120.1 alpha/beta hydrolase-fold protein [Lachnospiraceae bacterium]